MAAAATGPRRPRRPDWLTQTPWWGGTLDDIVDYLDGMGADVTLRRRSGAVEAGLGNRFLRVAALSAPYVDLWRHEGGEWRRCWVPGHGSILRLAQEVCGGAYKAATRAGLLEGSVEPHQGRDPGLRLFLLDGRQVCPYRAYQVVDEPWRAALYPFCVGLCQGTLPPEAFLDFLEENGRLPVAD